MISLTEYRDLINNIPVKNQSTRIKFDIWNRIFNGNHNELLKEIFKSSKEIEISRREIFDEKIVINKVVKTLMWGYPTGGRGNNLINLMNSLEKIVELLSNLGNYNLNEDEYKNLVQEFNNIIGLGPSTWTKFLYFFCCSIDGCKCQILDLQIINSLKRKQFFEIADNQIFNQSIEDYLSYIRLLNKISKDLKSSPENIELFLFYFNNGYKFA